MYGVGGILGQKREGKSWSGYLVDALNDGKVKLDSLKADELPEALRALAPAERKARVEQLAAERKQIQVQITKLSENRKVYLAEQEKQLQARMAVAAPGAKPAAPAAAAFERAVVEAVKAEAAKR